MAEAALDRGGPDAAHRVFAAADRPGSHRAMLTDRCRQLTGQSLRHLRAVDTGEA